jgi:APA family basic amino acid/polyamine antiporter
MLKTDKTLKQSIKLRQFFTLSFGSIVGVGWIIVMGQWLRDGGPLGASLAFLAAGLLMATVGICFAKLAERYPVTGGAVAFSYEVFGPRAAFFTGWFMALCYMATCGFAVVSTAWVIEALLPALRGPLLYEVLGSRVHGGTLAIGLVLLLVITTSNIRGAGSAARLQDIITYGLLTLGAIVVTVGLMRGSAQNLLPLMGSGTTTAAVWSGFFAVLATTPFFMSGFDVIPQAMGERHESVRLSSIGPIIVTAIVIAMIFYIATIVGTAVLLPRHEIVGFDLPVAQAFERAFNTPLAGKLVLLCGLFGVLSGWNAHFYSGARVLYALGHARLLPDGFAATSSYGTPKVALLIVAIFSAVAALLGRGAILPIVNAYGAMMSSVFLAMALAAWRLQARGEIRFKRPLVGRLVILCAGFFSAAIVIVALVQGYLGRTQAIPSEWVILVLWGAAGGIIWLRMRRHTSDAALAQNAAAMVNW